ncbi:MAG: hypothetical protein H6651_01355 [Ardenticatenales bacterium]|nr:hypothetical protein [Ardenticatenales bacterium]
MGLKLRILFPLLLMVLLWLPACSEGPLPTPTSTRTPPAATVTQTAPVGAEVATATMPSAPVVTLPPAPSVTPGQLPAGATEPLLSQRPPTAAENDTLARLLHDLLPVRDDIGLQAAFRGVEPLFPTAALVSEPLPVGSTATFKTLNFATNELVETEAVLLYVSDFAYFWFDLAAGQPAIPATTLTEAGTTFDQMHDVVSLYFGAAAQPGIDGDPRAYILHVTPQNLCFDVSCGIAGYFSSADVVPPTISPNSNGHELFIINQAIFDSASYFSTLAHEYRHLIEDSYDQGDWDWEVEGSAMLAELLWGDQRRPIERANLYLSSPDRSLYSWPDTATAIAYGQGFLLNQFLLLSWVRTVIGPLPRIHSMDWPRWGALARSLHKAGRRTLYRIGWWRWLARPAGCPSPLPPQSARIATRCPPDAAGRRRSERHRESIWGRLL